MKEMIMITMMSSRWWLYDEEKNNNINKTKKWIVKMKQMKF